MSVGDNMISIYLEFIDESSALGSFVVIEDHFGAEDTFVVLKRNETDSIFQNISVSASNYTVYTYDLEENALPNTHPAVSTHQVVSVNGSSKFIVVAFTQSPHHFLCLLYSKGTKPADANKTGSGTLEKLIISESGSNVTIDCFAECSSYLVVYRAYGDPTLNPIHNTTFPVTISLEIGTYTFAVFEITESSRGSDVDDTPLLRRRVRIIPESSIPSGKVITSTVMTLTMVASTPTPTLSQPGNFI